MSRKKTLPQLLTKSLKFSMKQKEMHQSDASLLILINSSK